MVKMAANTRICKRIIGDIPFIKKDIMQQETEL